MNQPASTTQPTKTDKISRASVSAHVQRSSQKSAENRQKTLKAAKGLSGIIGKLREQLNTANGTIRDRDGEIIVHLAKIGNLEARNAELEETSAMLQSELNEANEALGILADEIEHLQQEEQQRLEAAKKADAEKTTARIDSES